MTRSVIQMRPKGDPSALPYAPQRDLANIYAPMLREAFYALDKVNWPDYFQGWAEAAGITEEQFSDAVFRFAEAHRLFIRDREVDSPAAAFEKAGFLEMPHPIRVLLFARLGEVIIGGWFIALRDTTMQGYPAPQQADIDEMLAAGRCVGALFSPEHRNAIPATDLEVQIAKVHAGEMDRVVQQLHGQVRQLTETIVAGRPTTFKGRLKLAISVLLGRP